MIGSYAFSLFFLIFTFSPSQDNELPDGVLAQGTGINISEDEYYCHLTSIYRNDDLGQSLLEQIQSETAIEYEAESRGVKVEAHRLDKKIEELDARFREQSGEGIGLDDYLKKNNISKTHFLQALELSIAHEIMAREDFGIDDEDDIPVEKLKIWLKEQLSKTHVEMNGTGEGVLATINGRKVTCSGFGKRLFSILDGSKKTSLLTEMIGLRLVGFKAADMGIELEEEDFDEEIQERRAKLAAMEGLGNITYEGYLKATLGISVKELRSSDGFRGKLLLKKIFKTLHDEKYMLNYFDENREQFNKRFGRASRISTVFLKAIAFPNRFIDRKYDDAVKELDAIKIRIERGETTFDNMARVYSEHDSKKNGGDLGFLPPGVKGWEEIASAALEADNGAVIGPFKTAEGCHLIKVTDRRENPSFESVRDEVERDSMQRFYGRLFEEAKIVRRF